MPVKNGGWGQNRTDDTGIFSAVLYQLSYPATRNQWGETLATGRRGVNHRGRRRQQRRDLLLHFRQLVEAQVRVRDRKRFPGLGVLIDERLLAAFSSDGVAVLEDFLPLKHHSQDVPGGCLRWIR